MRDPHDEPQEHDAADPNWRHPVESMEPESDEGSYREIAGRALFMINRAVLFIATSGSSNVASWQVAYALGLPVCEGMSMTDRAKELGVTRACISKGAKEFQRAAQLPPSEYMKSEESTASYSGARVKQLSSPSTQHHRQK